MIAAEPAPRNRAGPKASKVRISLRTEQRMTRPLKKADQTAALDSYESLRSPRSDMFCMRPCAPHDAHGFKYHNRGCDDVGREHRFMQARGHRGGSTTANSDIRRKRSWRLSWHLVAIGGSCPNSAVIGALNSPWSRGVLRRVRRFELQR